MFKIKAENSSTGKDIELKPFYEIHHSFYTVYFNVGNGVNEYDKRLNSATIDRVEPDGQQDELGHGLEIQITAVLQAVQKHITGVTHTVVTTHISNILWKWIRAIKIICL